LKKFIFSFYKAKEREVTRTTCPNLWKRKGTVKDDERQVSVLVRRSPAPQLVDKRPPDAPKESPPILGQLEVETLAVTDGI